MWTVARRLAGVFLRGLKVFLAWFIKEDRIFSVSESESFIMDLVLAARGRGQRLPASLGGLAGLAGIPIT